MDLMQFGMLAQSDVDFQMSPQDQAAANAAMAAVFAIVMVMLAIVAVITLILLVSQWKIFTKAGKPGWASIIPIYQIIVLMEIIGRPTWWVLLCLIPGVNLVVGVIAVIDLAKSFGKGVGFAIGMILLSFIFLPILAFGDAKYRGPAAAQA